MPPCGDKLYLFKHSVLASEITLWRVLFGASAVGASDVEEGGRRRTGNKEEEEEEERLLERLLGRGGRVSRLPTRPRRPNEHRCGQQYGLT